VIVPQFSGSYFTVVMNGVEEYLRQAGYLHYEVSHHGRADLIDEHPQLLSNRWVDEFILGKFAERASRVPVVAISGHKMMQKLAKYHA
jgi:DNA-binding LacI/PurR family transcriptional regulator